MLFSRKSFGRWWQQLQMSAPAKRQSKNHETQSLAALESLEPRAVMSAAPLMDHIAVVRDGHQWILPAEGTGSGTQEIRGYGLPGDQFLSGDWNGDGAQDLVVVRPNAEGGLTWLVDLGTDNRVDVQHKYGLAGDTAFLGDWNGDGIDDLGVVRPNRAIGLLDWYLDTSRVEYANPTPRQFGLTSRNHIPVVGDWNGDGRDDLGAVEAGTAGLLNWYLDTNGDKFADITREYGLVAAKHSPVVGDWNGDGRDDLGVTFKNTNNRLTWLLDTSGDKFADITKNYGFATDRPIVVNVTNSVTGHDRDDQMSEALALGPFSGTRTNTQAGAISFSTDVDMFSFTVTAGQTVHFDIDTITNGPPGLGSYLRIFDAQGRELAANNDRLAPGDPPPSTGPSNPDGFDSYIPYTFTSGGTYYVGVSNWQHRTYNPGTGADALGTDPNWLTGAYSLVITAQAGDDRYEENDSISAAANLGVLTTNQTYALSLRDGIDWFRFEISSGGTAASTITTQFQHALGDVDLELYDSRGNLVRVSDGVSDSETISMDRLARGTYFLKVFGYNGATNPDYTLTINPPGSSTIADKKLYLNFDGASLSNAELTQWSRGNWLLSVDDIDPEGDGIQIQPFLQGESLNGQREAIISQIVSMVQRDLNPYGIQVLRHRGDAIDGRGVTTIFVGANEFDAHFATDIDYGNDNPTDIAFVTNEDWGTAGRTAIALADVVLHEAGHTFGLHHVETAVNGRVYEESMGFRYSEDNPDNWVKDTAFLDRTFAPYLDHGPTSQNSHQTMLSNFGMSQSIVQSKLATVSFAAPGVVEIIGSASADRVNVQRHGNSLELIVNGQKYALDSSIQTVIVQTNGDTKDRVSNTVSNAVRLVNVSSRSSQTELASIKSVRENASQWAGFDLPEESLDHRNVETPSHSETAHDHDILPQPKAVSHQRRQDTIDEQFSHLATARDAGRSEVIVKSSENRNVAQESNTLELSAAKRTHQMRDEVFSDLRSLFA